MPTLLDRSFTPLLGCVVAAAILGGIGYYNKTTALDDQEKNCLAGVSNTGWTKDSKKACQCAKVKMSDAYSILYYTPVVEKIYAFPSDYGLVKKRDFLACAKG